MEKVIDFSIFFSLDSIHSMENQKKFRPDAKLRFMDPVRQILRCHYYAYGGTYITSDNFPARKISFQNGVTCTASRHLEGACTIRQR